MLNDQEIVNIGVIDLVRIGYKHKVNHKIVHKDDVRRLYEMMRQRHEEIYSQLNEESDE